MPLFLGKQVRYLQGRVVLTHCFLAFKQQEHTRVRLLSKTTKNISVIYFQDIIKCILRHTL